MNYERLPAVDMDFVNSNAKEVDIGANYQEDRHEEGQDKMDVTVDPAEVPEAVHRLIIKESVHEKRAENNEKRGNVTKKIVLYKARTIRLKDLNKQNIDLESSNQHPEEGSKEKVVKNSSNDRAEGWVPSLTNATQKEQFG